MKVELVYSKTCPNVGVARKNLLKAFSALNLSASWREWCQEDKHVPDYVKPLGSPTILINGKEVMAINNDNAQCCRIYLNAETTQYEKAPSIALLTKAMQENNAATPQRFSWRRFFLNMPAVLAGTCPICWAAAAGIVAAFGVSLSTLFYYFIPFMVIAFVIALAALGYRANARWGYGPLLLGIVSALFVIVGELIWHHHGLLYLGTGMLLGAAIWNSWPKKKKCCDY